MQRISLVDPNESTREVLRTLLLGVDSVWLDSECARYESAAEVVRETLPDLVTVVLDTDPEAALQLVARLSADFPSLAILAIGRDTQTLLRALQRGARFFLLQPVTLPDLLEALRRAPGQGGSATLGATPAASAPGPPPAPKSAGWFGSRAAPGAPPPAATPPAASEDSAIDLSVSHPSAVGSAVFRPAPPGGEPTTGSDYELSLPAVAQDADEFNLSLDEADDLDAEESDGSAPEDIFETEFEVASHDDQAATDIEDAAAAPSVPAGMKARRDEEYDEDEEAPAPRARAKMVAVGAAKSDAAPAKPKERKGTRRATVRYYSRMNPDRVFPLLVMLTRQEVERIVQKHVEQKATGPLKIAKDVPLEIEPVLPGCVCHPPRVVTKLESADQAFTFHVVPHVVGDVTGARVLIRQDHATLAEIPLDIRVVQRTWVLVSGLSTVLLPTASAVMGNFGVDFTPKDGTSLYLAAMKFLFTQMSPAVLMAVLGVLTGLAWWFTRPKGRDAFWDINTKPAGP